MWSKLGLVVTSILLALLPLSSVHATSLIPSEKHYYTAQLRSDKRALNYAKIIFENKYSDDEMTTYKFSLPKGVEVQNLSVQQILAKRTTNDITQPCEAYETFDEWRFRTSRTYSSGSSLLQERYEADKLCIQYPEGAEVDMYDEDFDFDRNTSGGSYYDYNYYTKPDDKFKYSDLELKENGGEYTVTLSNTIKPSKQGAVLISYIADNVITGFMGRYEYNYKTLVSKDMVERVTVAINFDEDLYSREAKQKRSVETTSNSGAVPMGLAEGAPADSASSSRSTDSLQLGVGRGGVYTKTQTNLLPGDVMSVKGVFAEHPSLLFLKEIAIGLLVLALLVVGSVFGTRYYRKKHPKLAKKAGESRADKTQTKSVDSRVAVESEPTNLRLVAISALAFGAALVLSRILDVSSTSLVFQAVFWSLSTTAVAVAVPLAYVLRYGAVVAYKWAWIHVVICVVLGLFFASIGLLSTTSGPGMY